MKSCIFFFGVLVGVALFKIPPVSTDKYITINDTLPDLNRGGCGYFTYKLYQRVDKNKYDLVIIDGGKHVMLRDWGNDGFLDSRGYHTKLDVELNYGHDIKSIREDSLRKLIYIDRFWNKTFCREDTVIINNFINSL